MLVALIDLAILLSLFSYTVTRLLCRDSAAIVLCYTVAFYGKIGSGNGFVLNCKFLVTDALLLRFSDEISEPTLAR